MAASSPAAPPPRDMPVENDEGHPQRHGSTMAAAGLAVAGIQAPIFRYWVDELLWSQGRLATITIEEVLDQLGGHRVGGLHKPPVLKPPAAPGQEQQQQQQQQQLGLQQLLQQARLSEQQEQAQSQPQRSAAAVPPSVTTGVTGPLSRSSSSAELTSHSSRASSAASLDAAGDAAAAAATAAAAAADASSSSAAAAAAGAGGDLKPSAAVAAAAAAAGSSSEDAQDSGAGAGAAGVLGPTKRPDDQLLGYHHVGRWDLLWTKSVYAIRAARQLQPGQLVSAIAGLNCLSMKKRMVQTLRMALGAQAFQIVPLSFCIPEDLPAWQAWLASPQGAAADTGLWMLKTGQDAGKGLRLVHTQHALQVATRPPKNPAKPQHHIKVAQQYVTAPLLLRGRKFHLRLWLLVTGHAPLRAYLHSQGLVLFSSEPYEPARPVEGPGVRPSSSHVTNLARNEDTWVWGLPALRAALGEPAWALLWRQMKGASALTAAAALGPLRAAHRWLQPSIPGYGFQMLGLDFLIDGAMHPWLLEVNSAPSIMALHSDAATAGLIKGAKQAMLHDMMAMVQHRLQPPGGRSSGSSGSSGAPGWRGDLAAEMANRGGFEPLMTYFPAPQPRSGGGGGRGSSGGGGSGSGGGSSRAGSIPWQEVDLQLQQVLQQQYAGQC